MVLATLFTFELYIVILLLHNILTLHLITFQSFLVNLLHIVQVNKIRLEMEKSLPWKFFKITIQIIGTRLIFTFPFIKSFFSDIPHHRCKTK